MFATGRWSLGYVLLQARRRRTTKAAIAAKAIRRADDGAASMIWASQITGVNTTRTTAANTGLFATTVANAGLTR